MCTTIEVRCGGLLLGMALTSAACRERPGHASPQEWSVRTQVRADRSQPADAQLRAAIDRSAHYLAGLCDARGRFAYRTHLDPQAELRPAYNVLRHAGAVYALAQYCQRSRDPAVWAAMRRAAEFLRRECLGPVAEMRTNWPSGPTRPWKATRNRGRRSSVGPAWRWSPC